MQTTKFCPQQGSMTTGQMSCYRTGQLENSQQIDKLREQIPMETCTISANCIVGMATADVSCHLAALKGSEIPAPSK